MYVTYIIL